MGIRPIDANALQFKPGVLYDDQGFSVGNVALRQSDIDAAPTLDYTPVRHGEWVEEGLLTWCSRCLNSPLYDYFGKIKKAHYCPNCGAKMKED